jgi:MerR family transcriptional regulator, heat shock protein HspR
MKVDFGEGTGYFVISVAARMLGLHAQTLRSYERQGLVTPSRTKGRIRLYSLEDIQRAQLIRRLIEDLGVNLAGVEVIMRLTDRIRDLEAEVAELQAKNGKTSIRGPAGATTATAMNARERA